MESVRVTSWSELTERLYEGSWQPALGRFRSAYAYRGMPDASYGLTTSLMRLGGTYWSMEDHLLRTFGRYACRYNASFESIWDRLALAQHHHLPTRLLDWTYSPFVALHFATADLHRHDRDGVVWMLDYVKAKEYLPPSLKAILDAEGAYVFTSDILKVGAGSLRELEALADDDFIAFFEPPSLDDRIVNQFGLFALLSSARTRLDCWLEDKPWLYQRLVIPARLKWEVRDKLDQANITERVLFPGLDGLSAWLTRYYSPSPYQETGEDPAPHTLEDRPVFSPPA